MKKLMSASNIRLNYLFLFFASLYTHYYTWWMHFGYINDDFFSEIYHQTLFTSTELYSTWLILLLATTKYTPFELQTNEERFQTLFKYSIIFVISFAHVVVGFVDQFIDHIFYGSGHVSQHARDIGLVIPDLAILTVSLIDLLKFWNNFPSLRSELNCHFKRALIFTIVFIVLSKFT